MLVCNYCGRHFKYEYESCPGCGSGNFKKTNSIKQMVIETPPKDGYKVCFNSYEKEKKAYDNLKKIFYIVFGIFGAFSLISFAPFFFVLLLFFFAFLSQGLENFVEAVPILIMFMLISVSSIFMTGGMGLLFGFLLNNKKKEVDKDIERVTKLSKEGMLIKNLPFKLKKSETQVSTKNVYCIEVEFEFENGTKIPLVSNPKYDDRHSPDDTTADLLIDKNDYSNYYIDYEIY